jgi:putative two-component system response regulator
MIWPLPAARDYLIENKGRHFDPACVDAFWSRWDAVVAITPAQNRKPFQKTDQLGHSSAAERRAVEAPN